MAGQPLPPPVHVPLDDPLPIASWMRQVRRDRRTPDLFTFTSSAVRLCEAAREAGIDVEGAQFTVVGELLTRARLGAIRRSGAEAVPRFAVIECSTIGHGCLAAEDADGSTCSTISMP
jgi:hypothetical protein